MKLITDGESIILEAVVISTERDPQANPNTLRVQCRCVTLACGALRDQPAASLAHPVAPASPVTHHFCPTHSPGAVLPVPLPGRPLLAVTQIRTRPPPPSVEDFPKDSARSGSHQ